MTPEQRQSLIERHDILVRDFTTDEELEEIALLEMILLCDPNRPMHECDDQECIVCN